MALKQQTTLVAAACAGLGLLVSPPAHAQFLVELGPISTSVMQAIGRLESSVRVAVVKTFQQVSDGSNTTNADFHLSLQEQRILRDHIITPATCAAVDGGQSLATGRIEAGVTTIGVIDALDVRAEGQPGGNGFWASGQSARSALQDHNQFYCSPLDAQSNLCQAADRQWQDRDVRAISLFGAPTYLPDDAAAAQAYVVNAVQPVVPGSIWGDPARSVASDALVSARRQYDANISLANYVNAQILGSHAPTITSLTPDLQRQLELEHRPVTNIASWFDAMALEVARHTTLDYHNSLQKMSTAADVGREIVNQMTIANQISWAMYQRLDQLAALNAANLSYAADRRYREVAREESTMPLPQAAAN